MTKAEEGGLTRLLVRASLAGERLDRFLAAETGLSRRRSRLIASEGKVWKNGRSCRVLSKPVTTGDVIDLLEPEASLPKPPWRPLPIQIVHEDRWIVVAEKPSGMLSQAAEGPAAGEMAFDEHLLQAIAFREGHRPFLRMVHRLDRLTSGLVVFARNRDALKPINRAWRQARVSRFYLAAISGAPDWDQIDVDQPIGKDPLHSWRFQTHPDGKPARTRFTVFHRTATSAAVIGELDTGRTHQVRVHLQHLGHPALGDPLYGPSTGSADRLMLHAWALALPHPKTGNELRLCAQLPEEFDQHLGTTKLEPPWRR